MLKSARFHHGMCIYSSALMSHISRQKFICWCCFHREPINV